MFSVTTRRKSTEDVVNILSFETHEAAVTECARRLLILRNNRAAGKLFTVSVEVKQEESE